MTPTEVNALPERVRRYIHDLQTSASMQENARLREDAGRYRLLRAQHSEYWIDAVTRQPTTCTIEFTGAGHDLDAAIDAAMGSGGEQ